MKNSTDLNSVGTEQAAVRVLLATADHLNATDPTAVLEAHNLLICISAEAYNAADRCGGGEGTAVSHRALAMSPERKPGVTRGQYARLIWAELEEAGHGWPDGDNDPAIPRITGIPGPRREPQPEKPPVPPRLGGGRAYLAAEAGA
ncbi:hypothetical protein ACFWAP_03805 [Streptomyces goshikiensis]|uniref:hypothetical protein n=1 Tax=Streptomyces goshikiensis TaxID=1942 RepID=UPI00364D941B